MEGVKDLIVYKKAFALAMEVFYITKDFPAEEKYALTSQIRRSSRAVCANLAEAYRKRIYPAHFVAKISDANMENTETQTWLDFCLACNYLPVDKHEILYAQTIEGGKLLNYMIMNPNKCLTLKQKNELKPYD